MRKWAVCGLTSGTVILLGIQLWQIDLAVDCPPFNPPAAYLVRGLPTLLYKAF